LLTANEAIAVVDAWLNTLPEVERAQAAPKRELFVTGLLAGDLEIDLKVSNNRAHELMKALNGG
jgi:hypothetical protein